MMTFSVIIPVYNVIDYVSRCLESVLAAGRRIDSGNYEVICVDDGSTDGSGLALDDFALVRLYVKAIMRDGRSDYVGKKKEVGR